MHFVCLQSVQLMQMKNPLSVVEVVLPKRKYTMTSYGSVLERQVHDLFLLAFYKLFYIKTERSHVTMQHSSWAALWKWPVTVREHVISRHTKLLQKCQLGLLQPSIHKLMSLCTFRLVQEDERSSPAALSLRPFSCVRPARSSILQKCVRVSLAEVSHVMQFLGTDACNPANG